MKALFEGLPSASLLDRGLILLDTCFFVHCFEHGHESQLRDLCRTHPVAMTSFNAEEFLHLHHKFSAIEGHVRAFLKDAPMRLLPVPVHPGERDPERSFMASVDTDLPLHAKDPSDGVLLAAAILTRSTILTKDKHDVFNVDLENYLRRFGIAVHKELRDIT
jgi:hypothetical protein